MCDKSDDRKQSAIKLSMGTCKIVRRFIVAGQKMINKKKKKQSNPLFPLTIIFTFKLFQRNVDRQPQATFKIIFCWYRIDWLLIIKCVRSFARNNWYNFACIQKAKTSLVKHIFIILSKCPHLSSKSGKFSVKQIQTTLDVDYFFLQKKRKKIRKFFQPLRMWGNCSIIYWYFVLHCTKSLQQVVIPVL